MQKTFIMIIAALVVFQTGIIARPVIDTAKLFAEIKQMQAAYEHQSLSFDIKYTYASELNPALMLDSLSGFMEISGTNYHGRIDSMETFSNGRYNIVLFKEDKVMHLSRASSMSAADPLSQIRAMMEKAGLKNSIITDNGKEKTIQIEFAEGGACKQMELVMDKTNGLLIAAKYMVKTALLLPSAADAPDEVKETYGEFAWVRMIISNYKKLAPDAALVDEKQFFQKIGEEFVATPAYSEYTIFKGSPNL